LEVYRKFTNLEQTPTKQSLAIVTMISTNIFLKGHMMLLCLMYLFVCIRSAQLLLQTCQKALIKVQILLPQMSASQYKILV